MRGLSRLKSVLSHHVLCLLLKTVLFKIFFTHVISTFWGSFCKSGCSVSVWSVVLKFHLALTTNVMKSLQVWNAFLLQAGVLTTIDIFVLLLTDIL